jgi:transcription elongation factor Elf1
LEDTTTISCPYCNSDTLVILDGTDGELDLVSDCENCCRPINVRVTVEGGQVVGLMAEA